MSTEVTTGQGNLQGYELYDLVALSESEMAVVVLVGAEKLRVINNTGIVKDVRIISIFSSTISFFSNFVLISFRK